MACCVLFGFESELLLFQAAFLAVLIDFGLLVSCCCCCRHFKILNLLIYPLFIFESNTRTSIHIIPASIDTYPLFFLVGHKNLTISFVTFSLKKKQYDTIISQQLSAEHAPHCLGSIYPNPSTKPVGVDRAGCSSSPLVLVEIDS